MKAAKCFYSQLLVLLLLAATQACAQPPAARTVPRGGLTTEVRLSCADTPLRKAIVGLGEANRVAVFVDRRVNPSQEVALTLGKAPVWDVLTALAREGQAECVSLGNVVYVAPAGRAEEFAGVARLKRDEARRLPQSVRRRFLAPMSLSWDALDTPKDVLRKWEAKTGVDTGPIQEAIPHDLWAKGAFPEMTPTDMLSAILFGFDKTFRFSEDGRRVYLEKLPTEEMLRRRVPRSEVESALNPIAGMTRRESQPSERRGSDPFVRERFTLSVREKPLGAVLSHLAAQLRLEIDWGSLSAEEKTALERTRCSFALKKADLNTLLKSLFADTPFTFSREGARVEISRRTK